MKLTLKGRYSRYKSSAKRRGIDFNLSIQEFAKFWRVPCFYCGILIDSIGLDRRDNSKGYEPTNIVPCCTDCNRGKGVQSSVAFIERCARIARRHAGLMLEYMIRAAWH